MCEFRAQRPVLLLVALSLALASPLARAEDQARTGDQPVVVPPILERNEANLSLPREVAERLTSDPAKTAATVLSEGFESTWPVSPWELWHPTTAASVDWGRSSYRKASGSYSIWCAAGGSQAQGPGGSVPPNTEAWAIAGPFDLSAASSGSLDFDLWLTTEASYDSFYWMVSYDGSNYSGYYTSTNTTGFQRVSQDLTAFGNAGNATGRPQVWIAFLYSSDADIVFEGAYVDNVSLTTGGGGSTCGTYVVTEDNDNSAGTGTADGDWNRCLYNDDAAHPIEFHFDVNEAAATSAQLLLLCNDVDQYTTAGRPEVDKVFVNGSYVGDLTGASDEDSTTLFNVPVSSLIIGRNTVRIDVNQYPGLPSTEWCVEIKQAQLLIDGGCEGSTSCRSVATDRASYAPGETVVVSYEIDTSRASQEIRVETNLLTAGGVIVAGSDRVYTVSGSANEPQSVSLSLPSTAQAGTYTAQVLVFDTATGQLDTSCSASFTVTGGSSCSVSCNATVPATAQVGATVNLQGSATTTGCTQVDYFWFPDANTTATVPSQSTTWVYDTPGTYTWTFAVIADEERCERTGTITVSGGGCTLNCSASAPTTAAVNTTVQFQGSATPSGCTGAVAYFWDFGDFTAGSGSQNPTHVYAAAGTYQWQMTATVNGVSCVRSGTITVSGSSCTLNCSASAPTAAAVNTTVQFQGSATPSGCTGAVAYFWDFGDFTAGSGSQNPTHVYAAAGTYQWQMTATVNGVTCVRSGTITVTGGGGCTVNCSAIVPATAQAGAIVSLQGSATTSGCNTVEYFWFPDANTTATVFDRATTWVYDTPGTYTWMFVVIANGQRCERTGTIVVTGGGCALNCGVSVPSTAPAGATVTLQGWATTAGCTSVENFWFPDTSTTATVFDRTATWVYPTPGTYGWSFVSVANGQRCERTGTIAITGTARGPCAFTYWIPVASRAAGVAGSLWRTDVGFLNRAGYTVNIEVRLYINGTMLTRSFPLESGRQSIRTDIINWISAGLEGSGAIQVCADGPLDVTSRTYNWIPSGVICFPLGTLGQGLDGLTIADAIGAGQGGWLPQLVENASFRTNIGFTNMGTTTAVVKVSLYNGQGALLHTYEVTLSPGQWKQTTQPFRTLAGLTTVDRASAAVVVTRGSGVLVYGSVVDNISNDPTTIRLRR